MLMCVLFLFFYFMAFDMIFLNWVFVFTNLFLLKIFLSYFDGFMVTDLPSFSLSFISIWVFFISLNSSKLEDMSKFLVWFMLVTITMSFLLMSGFMFYLLFEFCFVLMFLFLMSWGLMLERVQASFYMFFYTLVFSLPFLILILEQTLEFTMNYFLMFYTKNISFFWIFMILVFVVKLPLFGFHLWLPKAHVEAPVVGSMILAGVLLKLGGYGLIRFMTMIEVLSVKSNILLIYLLMTSIFGGLLMNCVCMRQTDLKMFIAYSSVVHMSLVYLSAISFSSTGQLGCLLMMLAHGFISPVLFYLMSVLYSNSFTRSLYSLKGSFNLSPSFSLLWFLSCSLNFGFPPFMSFFSEVMITMSMTFLNFINILLMLVFFFLTGTYCIFLYISVTQGESNFSNPLKVNFLMMSLSCALLFYVFLYPFLFLSF